MTTKKQGEVTVVYLESAMFKSLSQETREKLLAKITRHSDKIYDETNAYKLLAYKKATIIRYGVIPLPVALKLKVKGKNVVSGNF